MRVLHVAVLLLCLRGAEAVRRQEVQETDADGNVVTRVNDKTDEATDPKAEELVRQMKAKLENVRRGEKGGPLIPAVVPGQGQIFEVANRERLDIIESNEYRWKLVSVTDVATGAKQDLDEWFATLDGGYLSNNFGWKTTMVKNNVGRKLFKIRLTKHLWNIFRWTWSFRIQDPDTDDVLFTINKDWFGTGVLWRKDEWRVYRGKKGDHDQIYHCVGSWFGYGFKCYHSWDQYNNGEEAVAEMSQSIVRDLVDAPDVFSMTVKENEDSALLMSVSVVMDMVHEQEDKDKKDKERREEEKRKQEEEQGGGASFVESDVTEQTDAD